MENREKTRILVVLRDIPISLAMNKLFFEKLPELRQPSELLENAEAQKVGDFGEKYMKTLLVYPKMPSTFWTFDHALKISGKKACYPPLGLCTVASMLPEEWEKRLIDINISPLKDSDVLWADHVLISAMNVQEISVREIIARCKHLKKKVILGGPLATNEYERFEDVDHLILNEAEITLAPFLKDLEAGHPKHIYQSSDYAEVQQTPVPMWELLNLKDYLYSIVQYSRGCPFQCDFCDVTSLFGHLPRVKTPEQIIAELEALGKSTDFCLFADDNLIGNKKHLKESLLPELIKWRKEKKPNITFGTQLTINLADDPELMKLLSEAGFTSIFIGIETPSEESLVECKKGQNTKRNLLDNIQKLQEAGFIIAAGFIVGFDTDTEDIFDRQIRFIQESGIVLAGTNLLKAPPGTELYNRMKRENRLIDRFSFDEMKSNFIPTMPAEVLENGLKKILTLTYSPEYIYHRLKKFLKAYNNPQVFSDVKSANIWNDILILFRCIYFIGIVGKERKYFWKILGWTFFKKRELVPLAIVKLVFMYQLRNLLESYNVKFDMNTNMGSIPSPTPEKELVETAE